MNLNEAYNGWQRVKENGQFYVKTRNDFRKAWLMLPTNKPCSYYSKDVLGEALAASKETEAVKARAASVMIQVLQWAHDQEPKESPKVKFTLDDLMAYVRGEVKAEDKAGSLGDRHQGDDTPQEPVPDGMPDRKPDEPMPEPEKEPAKAKKPKKSAEPKASENTAEGGKHPGGRPTRPVCQIDPDTLEVIATFDSCNAAIQATGASNIDRAVARVRKSAGYYWSTPDGVKTFAKRLREKQKADEQRHVEAAGRARAVKLQKIAEQRAQAAEAEKAEKGQGSLGDRHLGLTTTESQSPSAARSGEAVGSTPQRHDQPERKPRREVERMPEPKAVGDKGQSKVSEALAVFSDDELIEELDRRGWYGVMRKVMVVELTKD